MAGVDRTSPSSTISSSWVISPTASASIASAITAANAAYVGVMAQEVQTVMPKAVVRDRDGYLRVFYDKLGVKFQTYEQWIASGARAGRVPLFHTDMSHAKAPVTEDVMNRTLVSLTIATLLCTAASIASAQQAFKTPDEAASALVSAAKTGDRKAIVTVLGPDGEDIVSSGDEVADAATRQKFVAAYDAKHQIAMEGDSKAIMVIGPEDFPLPIPLIRKDGMWRFDTAAGREEILFRRIGRNELDAIQSCLAYVDAQNDYAEKDRTGAGVKTYAQRIISQPGKKDGLYWPTSQGEEASPLGELVAQATAQGYRVGGGRTPFHGYYFKILTKQGAAAPGGELEYVVRGKMIGGFALVAYPAEYGNSGVMTFIVNHSGDVFQKDLGPDTAKLAGRMSSYNPDRTWQKVSDAGQ